MIDLADVGILQCMWPVCMILVASWAVVFIRRIFVKSKDMQCRSTLFVDTVSQDDYPDLQIPSGLHLEVTMDPPSGLHCSNPKMPYTFDNDLCWGSYIFFHPPVSKGANAGAGPLSFGDYFSGKRRLWELRLELHFKEAPDKELDMFFGTELEAYVPLAMAAKKVMSLTVEMVRKAFGSVYHSVGDDPKSVKGELERPQIVLPVWAFDQFIETPEGMEPPSLTDPLFPEKGCKRSGRMSEYAQEIAVMKKNFRTGATYTFASWGVARFADILNWQLRGIPLLTPLDLSTLVPRPPVHCVLYTLRPGRDGETRHLASRKDVYFRASIWSSSKRPERKRFEELTGTSLASLHPSSPERTSHGKSFSRHLKNAFNCCVCRPDH
jgi:hypothetical protein